MESLCTRCARLTLRPDRFAGRAIPQWLNRKFSTTLLTRQEDGSTSSSNMPQVEDLSQGAARTSQSSRSANILTRKSSADTQSPRPRPTQTPEGGLRITRTLVDGPPQRAAGPPRQGQLLRRTTNTPQQGQLLRRTSGTRVSGTSGRGGPNQQGQQKRRRRPADRQRSSEDDEGFPTEAELDEYMTKHVDRPANPTEQITYNPKPQNSAELQKDWPTTPVSSTGLTASVVQKIEYLARRIPHGYQTPEQVAEHFQKGNLTRFESEEEKKLVLKIAQDLANKRAAQLTERKGEQITPEDMNLTDLAASSEDKKALVDGLIKGSYPDLEKQRMPFLDSIVRNLRNNETYGTAEMEKFMGRVQSMMPAQGARRAQPAQKS